MGEGRMGEGRSARRRDGRTRGAVGQRTRRVWVRVGGELAGAGWAGDLDDGQALLAEANRDRGLTDC